MNRWWYLLGGSFAVAFLAIIVSGPKVAENLRPLKNDRMQEGFDVFTDNVDGHYVQILKAKNPTADVTRIHIYKIQDSIDSPFGYDSLTMYADNLTADQQSVVIDLYNSWNSTD